MAATLRLSRKWGGVTDRNKWQVLVDGTAVTSIDKSETVEVPVEPGRHTLRVQKSDRFLSPERPFEAADGQEVSFRCRSQGLWPLYLVALMKPDLWISLKQE